VTRIFNRPVFFKELVYVRAGKVSVFGVEFYTESEEGQRNRK
jgi:hypothetical protein